MNLEITEKFQKLENEFRNVVISLTSDKPGILNSLRPIFGKEEYNFSETDLVSFFPKPATIVNDYLCFDFNDAGIKTKNLTFSLYSNPNVVYTSPLYRGHFTLVNPDMFTGNEIVEMRTDDNDLYLLWLNPRDRNYKEVKLGTPYIFSPHSKLEQPRKNERIWQVTGPHNEESVRDIVLKNTILPTSLLNALEYAFSYYNFCVSDGYREHKFKFHYNDYFFQQIIAEALVKTFPEQSIFVYQAIFASLENKIADAFWNKTELSFFYPELGTRYPYYSFPPVQIGDQFSYRNEYHPVFNTENERKIEDIRNQYHNKLEKFHNRGFIDVCPVDNLVLQSFYKIVKAHRVPQPREVLHNYHASRINPKEIDRSNPLGQVKNKNIIGWHISKKKLKIGDIFDSALHTSDVSEYKQNLSQEEISSFFPGLIEREDKKPDYIFSTFNGLYSFLTLEKAKAVLMDGSFLKGPAWIYKIQYEGDVAVVDESHFDRYEKTPETDESKYQDVFGIEIDTPDAFQPDINKYWAGEGSDNPVWSIIGNKGHVVEIINCS